MVSLLARLFTRGKSQRFKSWQVAVLALATIGGGVIGGPGGENSARADLIGHGGMVRAIDVSPDGKRVLTGSFDYTARLWDFGAQTEIATLDEHEGPVTGAVFLPDGKHALTTSDDRTAILWDLTKAQVKKRLRGHEHKVMTAAVRGDGRVAATASWDRTVRLWDLETGKNLKVLEHRSPINSVVFMNGGTELAAGTHDGKIVLWNADTGTMLEILEGHTQGISQLAASPDGTFLLSASIDRTLRVWDVKSRKQIKKMEHTQDRLGQVYSVAVSPDGGTALSAGRDGRLVQWDLNQGEPVREITAPDKIIWSIRFTPDGRFAVTGSNDDNAKVWHLETGDRIGLTADTAAEPQPWLTSDHPGAKLYTKCARCHSLSAAGVRRSGPHFEGLWGRRVGTVEGYKYSKALLDKDFVWDDKTLFDLFDQGPDVFLPGTKMPVQKVPNDEQLRQLVDFLKVLTETETAAEKGVDKDSNAGK